MQKLMMTTGNTFEGYTIDDYLGVYSGISAMPEAVQKMVEKSGIVSMDRALSDLMKKDDNYVVNSITNMRERALKSLKIQVAEAGGNAIVGMDMEFSSLTANLIVLIALGTAVKISKNGEPVVIEEDLQEIENIFEPKSITVKHTNKDAPFYPIKLFYDSHDIEMEIVLCDDSEVEAVLADLSLVTIFNETYEIDNVGFINFRKESKAHRRSEGVKIKVPDSVIRTLSSVDVLIKKYIAGGELYNADGVVESLTDEDISIAEKSNRTAMDVEDFLAELAQLPNVKKIEEYIQEFNKTHEENLSKGLIEHVEKNAKVAAIYGIGKEDLLQSIRKYIDSESMYED